MANCFRVGVAKFVWISDETCLGVVWQNLLGWVAKYYGWLRWQNIFGGGVVK